jgi:hypothetical protein
MTLDAASAARPPLLGHVANPAAALVALDEAAVAPVGHDGRFRFDAIDAGMHQVRVLGAPAWRTRVQVAGSDTVRVELGAPSR